MLIASPGQLQATRMQVGATLAGLEVERARDRTNTELTIVDSQVRGLNDRVESYQLGINAAQAELSTLGPDDPRRSSLLSNISGYQSAQQNVQTSIGAIYTQLRGRFGIPDPSNNMGTGTGVLAPIGRGGFVNPITGR